LVKGKKRNGVSLWSAVEPLVIAFEVEATRFQIRKDGTIQPPDTIGKKMTPRAELEPRIRDLTAQPRLPIAQVASELGSR
jgi:hypothetical protein